MKKTERRLCLFLALLLTASLLAGCGSSANASGAAISYASDTAGEMKAADYGMPAEAPAEPDGEESALWDAEANALGSTGTLLANVKMIYTASIALETTDFDTAVAGLEALVAEAGGWYENSQLNNSNQRYRRGYYTVRVPAENFSSFCAQVGQLCQLNSFNHAAQDVSEYYYDTESRLATQQTKLARLQELLAQAESMEDIITIESAISETELAIENLTGTLRHYDSLVGYSTVDITLAEVYQLTETEQPAIGFGEKLAAAFRSGSSSFVYGMQDLLLGFARGWAGWLIFLAIVAVVVVLIVRAKRRRRDSGTAGERKPRKQRKHGARRAAAEAEAPREDTQDQS